MGPGGFQPQSKAAVTRVKALAAKVRNDEFDYHERFEAACELCRVRKPGLVGTLVYIVYADFKPSQVDDFDLLADAFLRVQREREFARELDELPTTAPGVIE